MQGETTVKTCCLKKRKPKRRNKVQMPQHKQSYKAWQGEQEGEEK